MLLLNKRLQYLFLIVTILLFSVTCKTLQAGLRPKKESVKVENLFFTYDFTLEKKSVKQRVRFLDSLGYQGVTFPVNTLKDIEKLKEHFSKSMKTWCQMSEDVSKRITGLNTTPIKVKSTKK
jgi:hypothetical protein